MSRMQMSKCTKIFLLHKNSNVKEEKECNQMLCNSEDASDLLKKQKALNQTESLVSTSDPKVSSYSEKLLPFNKRKSQYYVWQEGESVIPKIEDNNGCSENEMEQNVKIRSLRSIYRRTKPITDV
ncbi:Glucose-6-phosphate isomerase 2 [Bienertia sinuspersici]